LLAWVPIGLRVLECVAATFHDLCDAVAETRFDLREHRLSTAVLGCIVKKRRNRSIFIRVVLKHQRGYTHDVCDVRDGCALANVAGMDDARKGKRIAETV
jgi:hypothetical protein